MRICIVGFGLTKERKEGVKNYIYGLSEQLSKKGFDIVIITIGSSNSVYQINGFKVIEIGWTRSLISLISGFRKMRQKLEDILTREKIDIIYDNFVLPGSSLFVTIPIRKKYRNIKLVKDVYNKSLGLSDMKAVFFPFEFRYFKVEGIFRLLLNNNIIDRYVFKNSDYLICHSSDISQRISEFKYKEIKMGIDFRKWSKKMTFKKPKKIFNLVFLGHPSLKKGINQFIAASKLLLQKNPNIVIHIALSKIAEGERKYAKMAINLREMFPGKVSIYGETDPLKVFRIADLVVLPLLHDWGAISPPLSLLEAMATARVVLSSEVCGVVDIIKDGQNGFLIEKSDPVNLARKIEDIMLNIDSSVSRKAQKTAKKYDWSEVAGYYKNFFTEIIT